ncbi:8800_t:CDS:2 [Funneliformis caledonium]|uniref:8800_t:CDS:1 n=1 Tax=Funneliformis caledonium TaxID=1117310 RepID=A0A9N8YPH8_9GLOM|nr:8800_t:CDS:2 [Funneliformis caledonium]
MVDRLGKLGVIDDKYNVTISTSFPALNDIVGCTTFILWNKLPIMDMRPIQTPENVSRLFDLIRPKDDMFIPTFYSVLQNTLWQRLRVENSELFADITSEKIAKFAKKTIATLKCSGMNLMKILDLNELP